MTDSRQNRSPNWLFPAKSAPDMGDVKFRTADRGAKLCIQKLNQPHPQLAEPGDFRLHFISNLQLSNPAGVPVKIKSPGCRAK